MKNINCCECGTLFGIEDNIYFKRLEDGKYFTCPNGHEQHFTNSVNSKLQKAEKEVKNLKQNIKRFVDLLNAVREENNHYINQRTALRGVVTKLQKKIRDKFKESE